MYDNNTVKEYVKEQKRLLKEQVDKLEIKPCLSVIQVGNNPSSNSYVKGKLKDCDEVGIICIYAHFDENITEEQLLNFIEEQNKSDTIHGIITQLPLPKHIDEKKVQLAINPIKDTDGFHPMSKFKPCTPKGVIDFLKAQNYNFTGKNALVIGRSDIVGKPLAKMLTDLNATVTLAHHFTQDMFYHTRMSDIIFTCINKINYFEDYDLVNGVDNINDIIDIGLGLGEDNKLHGNIQNNTVNKLRTNGVNVISGVGGIGLLTRLTLLKNTLDAYNQQM